MELKYLTEKRVENQEQMQKILNMAKSEKRALSEEEITKFNELKKLINEIDATIKAEEDSRKMDIEDKKVNCVIVKDLSRFGRDYIETGRYLEKYFPGYHYKYRKG